MFYCPMMLVKAMDFSLSLSGVPHFIIPACAGMMDKWSKYLRVDFVILSTSSGWLPAQFSTARQGVIPKMISVDC